MTERRQAPYPGKSAATSLLLVLIPSFFFMPLSVSGDAQQALMSRMAPFVLLPLSAAPSGPTWWVLAPYRRRDYTSPRRIGRRI